MATAITENPMASAIVTAQTEIHMINPMFGSPLNALMEIWFLAGTIVGTKAAMNGQLRQFRVPIAWIGSR